MSSNEPFFSGGLEEHKQRVHAGGEHTLLVMILHLRRTQINQMLDNGYFTLSTRVLELDRGSNALYAEDRHHYCRDSQRTN